MELVHSVERSERKISIQQGTINQNVKPKEYRHNYPQERANVISEIQLVCSQVELIATEVKILVDNQITHSALNRLQTQLLDGYDLLIVEAMKLANINSIITDDGDYITVPNIQVFTANNSVINTAQNQGKLIVR